MLHEEKNQILSACVNICYMYIIRIVIYMFRILLIVLLFLYYYYYRTMNVCAFKRLCGWIVLLWCVCATKV